MLFNGPTSALTTGKQSKKKGAKLTHFFPEKTFIFSGGGRGGNIQTTPTTTIQQQWQREEKETDRRAARERERGKGKKRVGGEQTFPFSDSISFFFYTIHSPLSSFSFFLGWKKSWGKFILGRRLSKAEMEATKSFTVSIDRVKIIQDARPCVHEQAEIQC